MRIAPIALALVAVALSGTAHADYDSEYIFNGCPEAIPQDEGGLGPLFLYEKCGMDPGEAGCFFLDSAPPRRAGALMIGVEDAESSRYGCSLLFDPVLLVPFVTDDHGSFGLWARWPEELDDGWQVYLQAYVLADESPIGVISSNTIWMEYFEEDKGGKN